MSKSEKPAASADAAALPDFQAGTLYSLQLSRPVEFPPASGQYLRPGDSVQLDGGYCSQFKDAIDHASAVTEPGQA